MEVHLKFHQDVSIYMLREINKRFELGLDPYSFDVLRNNQTISDTLDELSIKFPKTLRTA